MDNYTDVAKCLIFDANDEILVLTRSDSHPHFSGHPDFPGGKVESGEAIPTAVVREVEEETGIARAAVCPTRPPETS